jgi:hypothetical protein
MCIPEDLQQHGKMLIEFAQKDFERWLALLSYLQRERHLGKTEFRITWMANNHLLIHPLNKDGETLDIFL